MKYCKTPGVPAATIILGSHFSPRALPIHYSFRVTTVRLLFRAGAFAIALLVPSSELQAQHSLPFSDDALVLGFGQVRAGVHGAWQFYNQLYEGDGTVAPYGSRFSFASTGSAQFPALTNGENGIRAASGQSAFQMSLGTTDVSATHRTGSTSLLLDVGLPGRFMVSVEVPFVRVETTVNIAANNGVSNGANVGVNPALASTVLFAADTALANQITRAQSSLSAQLTSCLGSTASSCATINARRTEAQALVSTSATVAAGVITLASSPFAPLSSSTTQAAITARIAALASSYRDFGINSITGTTTAPASVPITGAQYRDFLANAELGAGGALPSYKSVTRLGDISVGGKFRITDTDRFRAAAVGKIYFPTGGDTKAGELLPVLAGVGTTRTQLGAVADFFPGTRLSITASGASEVWLAQSATAQSRRSGFNISLTPRYAINRWMMIGAQYEARSLNGDEDSSENRAGAGFSFSNLSASRTTGPRFPVEASFFHSQSISGKGLQPKVFADEFRIRIFARK